MEYFVLKFKNNLHTDTIVVSFMNVFTAVFCGFAVFAMLGFMAKNLGVGIDEVVQSGPGLAFIGNDSNKICSFSFFLSFLFFFVY